MKHNNLNSKKNNYKETAAKAVATLLSLATIILLVVGLTTAPPLTALGAISGEEEFKLREGFPEFRKAPAIVSGDNIYIAWWTNNTENGNEEVMFRASTDAGATFSDKINLSNTTDADSTRVEIAGEGDNVIVSWWETNQTSDTPVARISTDAGETFGPMLRLGTNDTISSTTEEEGGAAAEGVEEGGEGGEGGG